MRNAEAMTINNLPPDPPSSSLLLSGTNLPSAADAEPSHKRPHPSNDDTHVPPPSPTAATDGLHNIDSLFEPSDRLGRKRKKKSRGKTQKEKDGDRTAKREREANKKADKLKKTFYNPPSQHAQAKYLPPNVVLRTGLDPLKDAPVQSTGFQAKRLTNGNSEVYNLEQLKTEGYRVLEWDGV